MTKSEAQNAATADYSFWNEDRELVVREEARETKHFLRMVARALPELKRQARELWMEAKELHLIFSRIWRGPKNE